MKSQKKKLGIGKTTFNTWFREYERLGIEFFQDKESNTSYSKEFKNKVVLEYLSGEISQQNLCMKYNISTRSLLRRWIKLYNEGEEFEDYNPNKGIYLMKSRKVTKAEKLEIVDFCIKNRCNYKLAAEKFAVPYSQIYQWVHKHKKNGAAGLDDRRGRRKPAQELSEVEQLKKELEITKRKLEYAQIENEILKKKEEIELRQIFQKPDKR